VSGLVTEADWTAGRPDGMAPYVRHAVETFGPDRLIFGEFELVQGIHRCGNHIEDVAAAERFSQDIRDTCRFEHSAHTTTGDYTSPWGSWLEQYACAADLPDHFVRNGGFEHSHFMQVFAGVLRGFTHGIWDCIGFANTDSYAATVIADHDRHAERKPPTAFDNFCYTSDIYHALVQFLRCEFCKFVV
jgi:hypothetical protein